MEILSLLHLQDSQVGLSSRHLETWNKSYFLSSNKRKTSDFFFFIQYELSKHIQHPLRNVWTNMGFPTALAYDLVLFLLDLI